MKRRTRQTASILLTRTVAIIACSCSGCQWFVDDADREVYRLIEKRQQDALAESRAAPIDAETVPLAVDAQAYDFVPSPLDMPSRPTFVPESRPEGEELPAAVGQADPQLAEVAELVPGVPDVPPEEARSENVLATRPASTMPADEEVVATGTAPAGIAVQSAPADQGDRRELSLSEVLEYAFRNARQYQFAKEDLYLAALALTMERHIWTPRMVGEITTQYANYGQIRDFDHAMEAVARVGVQQRLPYGGDVTARVVSTLMRDLTNHVTTAETGAIILEANLPLLRGAGKVAYESRYQAERNLIYAVRDFERFRRALAVEIAGEYFGLQQLRQEIVNAGESIKVYEQEVARARALWRAGWLIQLEVQRAEQDRLAAENRRLEAQEAYQTALDQFKIRIGMPTIEPIDVTYPPDAAAVGRGNVLAAPTLEHALQLPEVDEEEATRVALKYRLDLLNTYDQIDDAARGVAIAENNLLPDLNAAGSVTMNTDPSRLGVLNYNTERTTWRGFLNLGLPLDRKLERNALRSALVLKRRAERSYEEARDTVRLQVRRALRRVAQEQSSLEIALLSRDLAVQRRRSARLLFDRGEVSNREIVEAEGILLAARNRLAQAQARVRLAVLQFLRDTEALRIDDNGHWAPRPDSLGG